MDTRYLPSFARIVARAPHLQRGTVLIIALIVLVAMTLAGIAMMRSVDTSTVVAGNISFKQSTVNGADQGIQQAYAWLFANIGNAALISDSNAVGGTGAGYFSSAPSPEPDWSTSAPWTSAAWLNNGAPDASGNTVYYLIHRMCPQANCAANSPLCANNQPNICGSTVDSATLSGEGQDQTAPSTFTRPPSTHYRITARAVGPRNSVTVVQTMVRF